MRVSEKSRNNDNNNSDNPLTPHRPDGSTEMRVQNLEIPATQIREGHKMTDNFFLAFFSRDISSATSDDGL